jgi:hypothetical protein
MYWQYVKEEEIQKENQLPVSNANHEYNNFNGDEEGGK